MKQVQRQYNRVFSIRFSEREAHALTAVAARYLEWLEHSGHSLPPAVGLNLNRALHKIKDAMTKKPTLVIAE